MRTAYKVLAYLVAVEVAVQAMVMVLAIAGLGNWVDRGGVFDKSVVEGVIESGGMPFPEVAGILVHGINGTFVVPGIALLLLIVSLATDAERRGRSIPGFTVNGTSPPGDPRVAGSADRGAAAQ